MNLSASGVVDQPGGTMEALDPPRIEARAVTYGYEPGQIVVCSWSHGFRAGSMTAITGPSGRGKSTLLYLLGLMLTPRSGRVLVNGKDMSSQPDDSRSRLRASQFGFVFQDAALDATRTVLDNILEPSLYCDIARDGVVSRALRLLDRFEVNVPAQRRPWQLSGGQSQRIALCRALLMEPAILLADEPTGNLDPSTGRVVVEAMREHADRGGTVIVVTHSPEVAEACDERAFL